MTTFADIRAIDRVVLLHDHAVELSRQQTDLFSILLINARAGNERMPPKQVFDLAGLPHNRGYEALHALRLRLHRVCLDVDSAPRAGVRLSFANLKPSEGTK